MIEEKGAMRGDSRGQHHSHDTHTPPDLALYFPKVKLPPPHPPASRCPVSQRESALLPPDTNPQCSGLYIPGRSHVVLEAGAMLQSVCLSSLLDGVVIYSSTADCLSSCVPVCHSRIFIALDKQTGHEEKSAVWLC